MSTVGTLIRSGIAAGFTLMELTVVIIIISLLLLFSFPMLRNISLFSNPQGRTGDLVRLTQDLKKRAVEHHKDFYMHLDTGSGTVWVTDETMNEDAKLSAKQNGTQFSNNISIQGVETPGVTETSAREYEIAFKKEGYSDFALIHMIENKKRLTLKIEPFFTQIQLLDTHIHFEDCL
jgi:prepilin-type N-terminal cleavage/methylation domain-containing protein